MTLSEIRVRVKQVRKSGRGWSAQCPAHRDQNNSLSIALGRDGRTLLYCFAGCQFKEIIRALGLHPKDVRFQGAHYQRSAGANSQRNTHASLIDDFETWRSCHIRRLNDQHRMLGDVASVAAEILGLDPENQQALEAMAEFIHSEAELCRSLDFLLCTKASEWLDKDATPVQLFLAWRTRRDRAE